jgi:hypothetical protein
MTDPATIDGLLVQWGDRHLYPGNRLTRAARTPRLRGSSTAERAAFIRERIAALVERRAPQVMVKVTGGGRGMKAIAAHFRYISKHGRLEIEDEQGQKTQGKDAVREMAEDWRYGGSLIPEQGNRREAFNIMLSMPSGTDASIVQKAAREFAQQELVGHKFVMVLHEHQANPHVHLSVRAEGRNGHRLNPRKAELRRWRETFAEKLRGWGVEAEATPGRLRGARVRSWSIGVVKAQKEGRLRKAATPVGGERSVRGELARRQSWSELVSILAASGTPEDARLRRALGQVTWIPTPPARGNRDR